MKLGGWKLEDKLASESKAQQDSEGNTGVMDVHLFAVMTPKYQVSIHSSDK